MGKFEARGFLCRDAFQEHTELGRAVSLALSTMRLYINRYINGSILHPIHYILV